MTAAKGGTIELGGKTYNISQINSVSVESVRRHSGRKILTLYFIAGIIISMILASAANGGGGDGAGIAWFIMTGFATWFAWFIAKKEDYAVVFDMSSGRISAYTNQERSKVEELKQDIINGMEQGYFPNYLQGRN